MASSTDQRRDLKFMLRPALSHSVSQPQNDVATSYSSLNIPFVSATLPWSQRLFLDDLGFMVATSRSCRDLT